MLTKKNALITSSGFFVVFAIFGTTQALCNYDSHGICWRYWTEIGSVSQGMLICLPLLLFSLISYKLQDEVFSTWVKFAKWWVLGTILLVLITPAQDSSLLPVTKEIVSLFSTGVFTLVSLIVIVAKSVSLKGKK